MQEQDTQALADDIVIEVEDLEMSFPLRKGFFASLFGKGEQKALKAVDGATFRVERGEILGLVGESGSGKTTAALTVLQLHRPTAGSVRFLGEEIAGRSDRDLREFRRSSQIVFQNPYESLNARFTIFDSIVEPLRLQGVRDRDEQFDRVFKALERSELLPPESFLWKYPHELSGGQRQRVAIARAIVLEPRFLVADEPVSMLDVSVRAGILNLLRRLSLDLGMAILYVSHDLTTVRYACQRTATMYAGKIVEMGETGDVISDPLHPYTQLLIRAIPRVTTGAQRERVLLDGEVPNLVDPPAGCRFHPRCPEVMDHCRTDVPTLREVKPTHWVSCHLY